MVQFLEAILMRIIGIVIEKPNQPVLAITTAGMPSTIVQITPTIKIVTIFPQRTVAQEERLTIYYRYP